MNGAAFRFLPDGRILLAEREGRLRIVGKDGKLSQPLAGMPPNMFTGGGQSLYDVTPDRGYATNRTVYLAYAVLPQGADPAKQRSPTHLHVASAKVSADDSRLEGVKDLLDAEGTSGHLVQANDGTLLVTSTVPAGLGVNSSEWMQPQQLDSLMGKVLRINADGSIPKDNPFVGRAGARGEIYALGFRDDQGMAIHPRTGRLWTSEHGPRGGDEVNEVEKGKNYGFPVIGYGRDYTGKPINGDKTVQAGLEQPVYFWTPDIAPGGHRLLYRQDVSRMGRQSVRRRPGVEVPRASRAQRQPGRWRGAPARRPQCAHPRRQRRPRRRAYVMTDGMGGKILRLSAKK